VSPQPVAVREVNLDTIARICPIRPDVEVHCWHWSRGGQVHERRSNGRLEQEVQCCFCGRMGLLQQPLDGVDGHGHYIPRSFGEKLPDGTEVYS
jgi:hypothetical protein